MKYSFADTLYMPGVSQPRAVLRLDDEEFTLVIPGVMQLLDIAANYSWRTLLPDGLLRLDRERMYERLDDPDDPMTWKRLHIVAQPVGLYLYGFPFFTAARALGTLRHYLAAFQMWAVTHLTLDLATASAAQWCAAAVTWLVQQGDKPEDHRTTWANLTIPGTLPMDAPGVSPDWMA